MHGVVVLYLHSTSNHNHIPMQIFFRQVVLYLHSTSNHNILFALITDMVLYYIFILHQTTTSGGKRMSWRKLYYIFILHQTTTILVLKFLKVELYYIFILHQTTTILNI